METRGGLEAYVHTGARHLNPQGWLVVCGDADARDRMHTVADECALAVAGEVLVIPREHRPPLFTVWALRHRQHPAEGVHRTLTLRDADGERTADAKMLRAFSGFPEKV